MSCDNSNVPTRKRVTVLEDLQTAQPSPDAPGIPVKGRFVFCDPTLEKGEVTVFGEDIDGTWYPGPAEQCEDRADRSKPDSRQAPAEHLQGEPHSNGHNKGACTCGNGGGQCTDPAENTQEPSESQHDTMTLERFLEGFSGTARVSGALPNTANAPRAGLVFGSSHLSDRVRRSSMVTGSEVYNGSAPLQSRTLADIANAAPLSNLPETSAVGMSSRIGGLIATEDVPRGTFTLGPRSAGGKGNVQDGYRRVIDYVKSIGYDTDEDLANFEGSEARMEKVLKELILPKDQIQKGLTDILCKSFPMTGDAGIVIQDCVTIGMCPHHFLPVIHQMYIGYLPKNGGNVLGMSKLIRIADLLSKRAILQEKLALDITATLFNGHYDDACKQPTGFPFIETEGAICVMGSLHCCMATRGVKSFSLAREVSLRGAFLHDKALKEEAFHVIRQFPSTQFPLK